MLKAKIISIQDKKDDQRLEEMAMSPEQRLDLGFQLMELAIAFSPDGKLTPFDDGNIQWIDLKYRNESG